jgi:hypothetical protein
MIAKSALILVNLLGALAPDVDERRPHDAEALDLAVKQLERVVREEMFIGLLGAAITGAMSNEAARKETPATIAERACDVAGAAMALYTQRSGDIV